METTRFHSQFADMELLKNGNTFHLSVWLVWKGSCRVRGGILWSAWCLVWDLGQELLTLLMHLKPGLGGKGLYDGVGLFFMRKNEMSMIIISM